MECLWQIALRTALTCRHRAFVLEKVMTSVYLLDCLSLAVASLHWTWSRLAVGQAPRDLLHRIWACASPQLGKCEISELLVASLPMDEGASLLRESSYRAPAQA